MKIETKNDTKKENLIYVFQNTNIRTKWDYEKEDYWFSVVDVIGALTGSDRPRKYWSDLKVKLKNEGSELSENIGQLKMQSKDGKFYNTKDYVKLDITDKKDNQSNWNVILSVLR